MQCACGPTASFSTYSAHVLFACLCSHIDTHNLIFELLGQVRPEDELPPASTPAEATRHMLESKKLSSKINYNALADLFAPEGNGHDRYASTVFVPNVGDHGQHGKN